MNVKSGLTPRSVVMSFRAISQNLGVEDTLNSKIKSFPQALVFGNLKYYKIRCICCICSENSALYVNTHTHVWDARSSWARLKRIVSFAGLDNWRIVSYTGQSWPRVICVRNVSGPHAWYSLRNGGEQRKRINFRMKTNLVPELSIKRVVQKVSLGDRGTVNMV